jgi:trans-aconitate methyltransferase
MSDELVRSVVDYYAGRFAEHGATARGVDWNGEESQRLRFRQLLRLHEGDGPFSVVDFGCGYGALAAYLSERYETYAYRGFDLAETMIAEARNAFAGDARTAFVSDWAELRPADYVVASGVFNVRLGATVESWQAYVVETLDRLWELSERGIAVNLLTSWSDPEHMRSDLWYPDPAWAFALCKRRWSKEVALLHDYGLYEFTMLVRHPATA